MSACYKREGGGGDLTRGNGYPGDFRGLAGEGWQSRLSSGNNALFVMRLYSPTLTRVRKADWCFLQSCSSLECGS